MSVGKIIITPRYTREEIQANTNNLYVFGDNLARVGLGGQAAAARGEPNAVGIPTKISPYVYFDNTETDFLMSKEPIIEAFVILARHLEAGNNIVWPADGVGTGLARLPEVAPKIFAAIERCREFLFLYSNSE